MFLSPIKAAGITILLAVNLTGCSGSNSEFESQVKQSWEEAFLKAQLDPCSFEGSSIRNATDRDPRFATWAAANPLSACPEKNYSGGSADCGGLDDEGNYIKITCDEVIGQIVGGD
jgi:hypothetical protein